MKSRILSTARLSFPLASAIAALLAAPSAQAGILYWDGGTVNIGTNGNGVSLGTAGEWDNTLGENTLNWDQGAGLAHVAWTNANLDTAFFGGTAGTVTLTDPISVGGLTFFSNSGYTIAAGAEGLTFGEANNTISLVNQTSSSTSSATISGTVAGNNVIFTSLNRNVASTLAFTGATAGGYTGTTTVGANMNVTLDAATNLNRNLLNTTGITLNGGSIDSGLIANNANGSANRINDLANWTVNSGSFTWGSSNAGGTYRETLGTVALTSGQMNFALRGNLSSGSQELTLSSISGVGLSQTGTAAVTFSNNATSLTTAAGNNRIRVFGIAASTPAGQIIAPWATVGSTAGNQTDYATYASDGTHGYVVAAGATLTAPGEALWASATDAYQFAANETLTANRTAAALRSTGGTPILALGGFTLSTNGILAGASPLTVSGAGALTATGVLGGNLYLTAGNNAITVSSAINDNGGAVTVVKNGGSNLTLSSTTSNFSGGTVVNAGTLTWTANTNLGSVAANRDITVNGTATLAGFDGAVLDALTVGSGGVATLGGLFSYTFTSASGAGTIIAQAGQNKLVSLGNASAFTGNLALAYASNNLSTLYTNPHLTFSSLNDAVGSAIQIYRTGGGTDSGQVGQVALTGNTGAVQFDNRQIQLLPRTGTTNSDLAGAALINNNATAANTWIINTPLLNLAERTNTLHLAGTNTGANAFNGTIGDSQAGFALTLLKASAGTWRLGGANTFTGTTTVSAGTLTLTNALALQNSALITTSGTSTISGITTLTIGGLSGATGNLGSANVLSGYTGAITALTLNPQSGVSVTYGGVIANGSGAMTLTKTGAGTQILSGNANTYTGATSITAGTLALTATTGTPLANTAISVSNAGSTFAVRPGSGTVNLGNTATLAAGATLNLGSGTVFSMVDAGIGTANLVQEGTFSGTALTLDTATLNFDLSGATADRLALTNVAATASVAGTNTINLTTLAALTAGTRDLITTAAGAGGLGGTYQFATGLTTGVAGFGGTNYQVTLGSAANAVSVTIAAAPSAMTWTSQVLGNGATDASWNTGASSNWALGTTPVGFANGNSITFQDTNTVTAGTVAAPSLAVVVQAGGVSPGSTTFNNSAVNYTVSGGGIGGTGGLTKNGSGTVILTNANTYTGATIINDGRLQLGNGGASGTLSTSSTITVNVGGNLAFSNNAADFGFTQGTNFANQITGAGSVTMLGGNLTLVSATTNNYSGGFTLQGGTVYTGTNGNAFGTGTLTLAGGTLSSSQSGGAGTTLTTTNANIWSGNFSLNSRVTGGSMVWNNNGTVLLSGGSRTVTGSLAPNLNLGGVISDGGNNFGLTFNSLTSVNMSGVNTYTGNTTIGAGTFTISGSGSLNSGNYAGAIANAGTLFTYASSANQTLSGAITGVGALTKGTSATSTLTLSGNSTRTGGTNINAGIVNLGVGESGTGGPLGGNGGAVDTSIGIIAFGGGTLQFSASNQVDYSSRFSEASGSAYRLDTNGQTVIWATGRAPTGTGTLTKLGAGTLNITTAANAYTGTTTVNAGTLKLGANNVLPNASNVSIGSATLDADTRTDIAGTLDATGTAVINLGAGAALAFANSSGVTLGVWAGALNITGTFVSGSSLRFGTTSGGLTVTQLGQITGVGAVTLDTNGFLISAGGNTYADWLALNGPATGFVTDSDNDGLSNGVENVLGSNPNTYNAGLTQVSATANSVIFKHTLNPTVASDVTYSYQWSTDMVEWKASNETNAGGTTATIAPSAPALGVVTVTITITGGPTAKLFGRLVAVK